MSRYVAITPARDEEALLPGLIGSMTIQRCLPERWIIVDDGSTDATALIADEAARRYRWIEVHHLPAGRPRAPGGESVIMSFLPADVWRNVNFLLRLDADLSFAPDFVDLLLREFDRDPRLGIASCVLMEMQRGRWREVRGPAFHTRGAAKMYSRECFAAIGGLHGCLGWDTLDELRAMTKGFGTRSFQHVRAFHHRPAGTASGRGRGLLAAGRAAYQAGYAPLFMLARAARCCFSWPWLLGGALMLPVKLLEYVSLGIPVISARLRTIEHYFPDDSIRYFSGFRLRARVRD